MITVLMLSKLQLEKGGVSLLRVTHKLSRRRYLIILFTNTSLKRLHDYAAVVNLCCLAKIIASLPKCQAAEVSPR